MSTGDVLARDVASRFARSLDGEDDDVTRSLLHPECEYRIAAAGL